MDKTPGVGRIILCCTAIGAVVGGTLGACFGLIFLLEPAWLSYQSGERILLFLEPIGGACIGLMIGGATGLILGLANGLALAVLVRAPFRRPTSLRPACGLVSLLLSLSLPVLAYSPLKTFLISTDRGLAVAIVGAVAAVAWWASGLFFRWYVSNTSARARSST